MLISNVIFVVASYVGASPSTTINPDLYQQTQTENNHKYKGSGQYRNEGYINPKQQNNNSFQTTTPSEPEEAQAGRMVVPEKFR
ncbi:MAG: hypothetical protein P1U61_03580 [Legionellaceae bacterium]|nr:hypothetical protein [Legionellaceae bacterium]